MNKPIFAIIAGGVCSGKTYIRKAEYSDNYVSVDAGDIFIELSIGEYYDFPSHLEDVMNRIGLEQLKEAIKTKQNIVIEIIGSEEDSVLSIIKLIELISYEINYVFVDCELDVTVKRNENRSENNISAYFTEKYHYKWIEQIVNEFLNE
jgi:hypothetical protein